MNIKAHGNFVLVTDLEQGRKKTKGGILLPDIDDLKDEKRPRWAKVHSIGPRSIVKDDIKKGDWICITYLRWTNGFDIDDRFFNCGNRIVFSGSHSLYLAGRMGGVMTAP